METGNITTNTMNVSHANITKDNKEDLHIAGFHTLCVFINTVGMLWLLLFFWLTIVIMYCFTYKRMEISPDKYKDLKKSAETIMRVWSFINFVILWLNMPVLIYCYTGSRNCALYFEDELSMIHAVHMFIACAAMTYMFQLIENIAYHRRKHKKSSHVLITALHEDLLQLIYWQKPVIKWTAKCYHTIERNERVITHTEEAFLEFSRWKTVSVWKEALCGFYQVAHTGESGISISGHTRVKITVLALSGDPLRMFASLIRCKASTGLRMKDLFLTIAVTRLQSLDEYNVLKDKHPRGLHDEDVTFSEVRSTSSRYFISDTSSFCSSKIVRFGYCVSGFLGLGPVYRLILFFTLPEEHYVIEKHVYSSAENVEAAPCNDVLALDVNSLAYHEYSSAENMEAAPCDDVSMVDIYSFKYRKFGEIN